MVWVLKKTESYPDISGIPKKVEIKVRFPYHAA